MSVCFCNIDAGAPLELLGPIKTVKTIEDDTKQNKRNEHNYAVHGFFISHGCLALQCGDTLCMGPVDWSWACHSCQQHVKAPTVTGFLANTAPKNRAWSSVAYKWCEGSTGTSPKFTKRLLFYFNVIVFV